MSDEIIWVYASQVQLEQSGASTTSDSWQAAGTADLNSANHSNFPWCDFCLACNFGGAVGAGKFVKLYKQALNIIGADDAPVPASIYEYLFVGSFPIPEGAAGTTVYIPLTDIELDYDQQYSIENKTDQTINASWNMWATPKTYKPKT